MCNCNRRELFKPIFKSDEQILAEREQLQKERAYEREREVKDAAWNERRRQQSIADKLKNKKK